MRTSRPMRNTPVLYHQLRELGISRAYASEVANGHRTPSLALSLRLYEKFGVKVGRTLDKTDKEIRALKQASRLLENGSAA